MCSNTKIATDIHGRTDTLRLFYSLRQLKIVTFELISGCNLVLFKELTGYIASKYYNHSDDGLTFIKNTPHCNDLLRVRKSVTQKNIIGYIPLMIGNIRHIIHRQIYADH